MTVASSQAFAVAAQNSRITSDQIELIPANEQLAKTGWHDRGRLQELLGADVPDEWPPELVTDKNAPNGEGWCDWYVIRHQDSRATLIGMMGLKGWLEASPDVQLGCAFLRDFQRSGYGTRAVQILTEWVLELPQVNRVLAETPIDNEPAATVLRRLGYEEIESDDPSLLRFQRSRVAGHDYRATAWHS
jgi:[ribosomal protein S5]-alanine N-acetyltransferase